MITALLLLMLTADTDHPGRCTVATERKDCEIGFICGRQPLVDQPDRWTCAPGCRSDAGCPSGTSCQSWEGAPYKRCKDKYGKYTRRLKQ